jgi:hypothetical protein
MFQKRKEQSVFGPQSRAVSRVNYVAPFHAPFRTVTVAQLRCRRHEACISLDLYNSLFNKVKHAACFIVINGAVFFYVLWTVHRNISVY